MRTLGGASASGPATTEAERVVAWLRLPATALLALGQSLEHPNPAETRFFIALAFFAAWSATVLAWAHVGRIGARVALALTGVDIAALSLLSALSGGAFSHARLGFFIVPVTVAFRFRPAVTGAATLVATAAYLIQAAVHPASDRAEGVRFVLTQAGFLLWVGLACVLLSLLLARRTETIMRLAESRTRLLADALSAEQRERQAMAEGLHDHAMQNLLSARHEIEEVNEGYAHPALDRADAAISETLGQLRNAVFELHPYVVEQAGLASGVRAVAQHAASRGGFGLDLDLDYGGRHPHDQLLFSAARELLANVVEHADATRVHVGLASANGEVVLVVEDDGKGFPPERLAERLAGGHVGLASQRVRVEAAGGTMNVVSRVGEGTRAEIRLPAG